jgi:hypothetical protein
MPVYLRKRGLDPSRRRRYISHRSKQSTQDARSRTERRRSRKTDSTQGDGGRPQGPRTDPGTGEGRKAGTGPSSGHRAPPGAECPGSPSPPGRRFPGVSRRWRAARRRPGGTPTQGRRKANPAKVAWRRAARRTAAIRTVTSGRRRLLGALRARGADGGWGLRFSASRRSLGLFYVRLPRGPGAVPCST